MKSFNHKQVLVLGAGLSGRAAAALLLREGCRVTLVDKGTATSATNLLCEQGVEAHFNVQSISSFLEDATAAIVSPGLPPEHAWIIECQERGMDLLSELELGLRFLSGNILAITGSLGKSTCVALSTFALNRSGVKAVAGGNFGIPVCELALNHDSADWKVLEVSSFQLEWMDQLKPTVGVLMNIYPNHLDRHKTMARYFGLKLDMFKNMDEGDTAIIPQHVAQEVRWLLPRAMALHAFDADDALSAAAQEYFQLPSREGEEFEIRHLFSTWPKANQRAWVGAMRACGVGDQALQAAIEEFRGLPHRFEYLPPVQGIHLVNDSKSTCLQATRKAIEATPGTLHLIVGGRGKVEDDLSLKEVLEARKVNVYLIGEMADPWYESWSPEISCRVCGTLENAVDACMANAEPGDTVLLSPGAASYDQFKHFEARGNAFKKLVQEWERKLASKAIAS